MDRSGTRWATVIVAAGLFIAGGLGSAAQDATDTAGGHAHPAHIHVGSCDALDPNPTHMLTDVALADAEATSPADGAAAIPVERSMTTVEAPLDDLRTGGFAINIHQSVDDIGTYIACGNLSGAEDETGALVVGLGELNGSGHSGIAILTENGDQTDVNVYLTEGLSGAGATAAATATEGTEATADATMVDIKDFAYNPAQVDIPVGATVTWTNSDSVPHTATAQDRAALQSGTLQPGDTYSQTFAEAGTFDYFCEFHPNMKGTIVVQ